MKKLILFLTFLGIFHYLNAQNDVMMQAFYWNVPVDASAKNGTWWDNLSSKASELKSAGFSGIWVPSPAKGNWGIYDMGYGIYDHYDLGNYNQKGSVETRFGSRTELENMISVMHNTPKIEVYADIVLNHVYSSDENDEINPAVKDYVFLEAFTNGSQHVPYPTNEIKWVIPNAGAGDYYIKIKGYYLDYSLSYQERAYDFQVDWTGSGFNSTYSWETEPNDGNGQNNFVANSGQTMRGFIGAEGDIDEYKITLNASNDIVIKLTSRREVGTSWEWADQTRGYYPFEVWHNGQNLAANQLEAHTNTNISYPNHTGVGEANVNWHYNDFHPVDANDWLGDWGTSDEIIPNTKGFGNDFNTYSATVQQRMNDWGAWLANQIAFDGFRLDFVRGFQESYVASWVNNLPLIDGKQRFIVGEYWGADYRIKDWVNNVAAYGADVDGFDFPLKTSLTDMCNGNEYFDMRWLNHAGMVRNANGNALPGTSVVTFLDNHDTGKEHDKWVTKDWKLGYAYMLTHEGRPCVFYPHYFGITMVDNNDNTITVTPDAGLKDDINKLIFARKTYMGGTLAVLSEIGNPYPASDAYNVYIARRQGNGVKDGAIIVINNSYSTKGLWVDSSPAGFSNWSNSTLTNAFTGANTSVYADGRVWLEAPPRSYAIYVLSTDYVTYGTKSAFVSETQSLKPLTNDKFDFQAFPNPFTKSTIIRFNTAEKANININIYDKTGRKVSSIFNGEKEAGNQEFKWIPDGIKSGIYFAVININSQTKTLKLVIN